MVFFNSSSLGYIFGIDLSNWLLLSVSKSSIYLKVLLNFLATEVSADWVFHKIKFKREQKEIRNQRSTIGTHRDTNGLLKNT